MIPDSAAAATRCITTQPDWKQKLAESISNPEELLRQLGLDNDPKRVAAAKLAGNLFKLRVTQSFVDKMQPGNPDDPLLKQVLPLSDELQFVEGFHSDPVGDLGSMVKPGLLHKYAGRALLVTTGACAIHCRYCFRREFPYSSANPKMQHWQHSLEYIEQDTTIKEIILSGGDPLTLTNPVLADLLDRCESISHVQRLRIHSRLPIVLPERIDKDLCRMLSDSRLPVTQVIHCNHAQEIDQAVTDAVEKLRNCSQFVLNQAVLLKGVNDSSAVQIQLSEALTRIGIIPYYLHMLDQVNGTSHFEVSQHDAVSIMNEVRASLPGYMVPQLVRETAGQASKTPILDTQVNSVNAAISWSKSPETISI